MAVFSQRLVLICVVLVTASVLVFGGRSGTGYYPGGSIVLSPPTPGDLPNPNPATASISSSVHGEQPPPVSTQNGEAHSVVRPASGLIHPTLVGISTKANSEPYVWLWRRMGLQRSPAEWTEASLGQASDGVPQQVLSNSLQLLKEQGTHNNLPLPRAVSPSPLLNESGGLLIPIEPINTKLRIKVSQIGLKPLLGEIERLYKGVDFRMPSPDAEAAVPAGGGASSSSSSAYCGYPMPNRIFIDAGARSYDKKSSVAHFQRMYPHASSFRCIALELLELQQTYKGGVRSYFTGHNAITKALDAQQCDSSSNAAAVVVPQSSAPLIELEDASKQQQQQVAPVLAAKRRPLTSFNTETFSEAVYPGFQYIQKAAWTHNNGVLITGMKMAMVSDESEQVTANPETGEKPTAPPHVQGAKTRWLAPSLNLAELIYKEVGVLPAGKQYESHEAMMADVRMAEEGGARERFRRRTRISGVNAVPNAGVRTGDAFTQSGLSSIQPSNSSSSPLPRLPSSFVVLKIDIEGGEWRLLPYLVQTGVLPHYIDEVLLECHALDPNHYNKHGLSSMPQECVDMTNDLRAMGVYAHRWI